MNELNLSPIPTRHDMNGREITKDTAIDESDTAKIQENLILAIFEEGLNGSRQRDCTTTKSKTDSCMAIGVQNGHVPNPALFYADVCHRYLISRAV